MSERDEMVEAFARLRAREVGSGVDFEEWQTEFEESPDAAIPLEEWEWPDELTEPPFRNVNELDELIEFIEELCESKDPEPEWPFDSCPTGCQQPFCVHGPHRN